MPATGATRFVALSSTHKPAADDGRQSLCTVCGRTALRAHGVQQEPFIGLPDELLNHRKQPAPTVAVERRHKNRDATAAKLFERVGQIAAKEMSFIDGDIGQFRNVVCQTDDITGRADRIRRGNHAIVRNHGVAIVPIVDVVFYDQRGPTGFVRDTA